MTIHQGVHPDQTTNDTPPPHNRVHHVRAGELDGNAAISGTLVGSRALWMGEVHNGPLTTTGNHHHGASEAAVYVVSGHPVFVFHDGTDEVRICTGPGDFVYVPPFVPHREENPDPHDPAVMVIARSTQEPILVELPELYAGNSQAVAERVDGVDRPE
ncbi:MAG: cupin domain-containing protein [Actinomycetota bacterium]|nr:cupin domain-containing protein [Actinomycetota bacterium]